MKTRRTYQSILTVGILLTIGLVATQAQAALISGEVIYSGNQTGTIHITASATNTAIAPTNGLVAYYPFNGNANDESGNGHTGVVHGADLTTNGWSGSAYDFGSELDYIEAADSSSLDVTNALTLSAWINLDSLPGSNNRGIVSKYAFSGGNRSYALVYAANPNTYRFVVSQDGITNRTLEGITTFETDRWYHICGVFEPNESMKIYVDGKLDAEITNDIPSHIANTATPLWIGVQYALEDWLSFDGQIDEVRVYNRVLSSTEVAQLNGIHSVQTAVAGAYSITNLPIPADYVVTAFMDSNSNGVQDVTEASGSYSNNPVYVSNDVTGVDIELTDPDLPPSNTVASISGEVIYSGSQTGTIHITASATTTVTGSVEIAVAGAYSITNLPIPADYVVTAFMDSNSNGVQDVTEASGSYSNNPVYVSNDVTGVDIELTDPDLPPSNTVASISGEVTYSGSQTGIIHIVASAENTATAPTNGLVAYYPFNGNANDESGNGNTGIVHGAVLTIDRFSQTNNAYAFDGNDYINVGQLGLDTGVGLTLSGWCRLDDKSLRQAFIGALSRDPWNRHYAGLRNSSYWCGAGDTQVYSNSASAIKDNEWFHFVLTMDGSTAKYYINGQEIESTSYTQQGVSDVNTYIGSVNEEGIGYLYPIVGVMDEVCIYDRPLLPVEIRQLCGIHCAEIATPGAYSITNLPVPADYIVTAFMDSNSNGVQDVTEASGSYSNNPVYVSNNVAGVDILLEDPVPSGDGLILHYTFDEDDGDVVIDQSGNNHTGLVNGATWITNGFFDGAYEFDGENDRIQVPNDASLNPTVFTVSAWATTYVATNEGHMHQAGIFGKHRVGDESNYYWMCQHEDELRATMKGSHAESNVTIFANVSPLYGAWALTTLTYDGEIAKLYVNGTETDTMLISNYVGNAYDLLIGAGEFSALWQPQRWWDGMIDDFRMYDRALGSSEVSNLFAEGGSGAYWLDTEATAGGTVDVGDGWYSGGTSVTVTATASNGYVFSGWTGDVPVGNESDNPLNVVMDQPRDITALFSEHLSASISGMISYSGAQTGIICVAASAASTATAPTNGLVAYYPFNGNANDESGNGNTGVVHGADLTTNGWSGSAYDFGSELDYIEAADSSSLDVTNALTLSAWINLDSLPGSNNRGIVSKYAFSGGNRSYALVYAANPNTYRFVVSQDGITNRTLEGITTFETDRWYHICGVFEPNESMKIYVDGKLDAEITNDIPSHIANTATPLWIGVQYALEDWLSFDGQIDEVRVYNRVLSSTEVAQLNGIHSVQTAVAGAYSITNLPIPADYVVTAFMDSNSNGVQDVTEASGSYSNNPVYVSNDVTGVDIELTDPDLPPSNTVASISGTVTYSGVQTGTIHITASAAPTNGLVAYYPFNGNANDESGNGNTGVVHGADLTTNGWSGSAYDFGSELDYIEAADSSSLDVTNALTLSAWINLDSLPGSNNRGIVSKYAFSGGNRSYALVYAANPNTYRFVVSQDGITNRTLEGITTFETDRWYHICGVFEPNESMKIYVDGKLDAEITNDIPSHIANTATPLWIGVQYALEDWLSFDGQIDEVRVYNRVLSSTEVAQLNGIHSVQTAVAGAYSITNLPIPDDYVVSAFMDTNGNGVWDGWEPKGAYPFNPVYLTNDVIGVDILLSETISGDSDNDGISDIRELQQGSDPGNPDSFPPVRTDFDGDGNTDLGCYDAAGIPGVVPPGTWYFMISGDGFRVDQFGYAGTIPVVGDFDGDGVGDYGCYDPAGIPGVVDAGGWYFMKSTEGFDASVNFGYVGTVPVVGDFDGDGTDDYGCYDANGVFGFVDPGAWYFMTSSNGFLTDSFGYAGTVPVAGDFDGDGIDDYGCYDAVGIPGVVPPGQWYIMKSRDGFDASVRFGYEGTVPVVGDFDGDGIDDYGCYDAVGIPGVASPGSWYFLKSADGFDDSVSFGYKGTVPIVGDYDKDGIDDYGCFDAAGIPGFVDPGSWYLMKSTDGFDTETFGYDGTVPLGGMPVE